MQKEEKVVKNETSLANIGVLIYTDSMKSCQILTKKCQKMTTSMDVLFGLLGEKVKQMSMEAIEKVTQVENLNRERKIAAEAEAKQMIADAERGSLALLQQVRENAADAGKTLLRQAEDRAAARADEIRKSAEAEAAALRETAEKNLAEAAEFIVGRVVKH